MSCSNATVRAFLTVLGLAAGSLPAAGPKRLTTDGKLKSAPVFASREEIVFAVHQLTNQVALRRLRLNDGSQEVLHPAVKAHQFDPAYSTDGRYHCYCMSSTSPQLVLVIQDTKEKTESVFKPREARATARGPSFTPDGT